MDTEGLPTVCLLTVAGLYCLARGLLAWPAQFGAPLLPLGIAVAVVGSILALVVLTVKAGRSRS